MPMTKEQQNKRRADLRFQTASARYQSRMQSVLELWIRAKRDKMTHSAICEYKLKWISSNELPDWIQYKLEGVYDALSAMAYRMDLVFCYPHPDTGVITDAHTLCEAGLASRLKSEQGNHYWKNDDGTFSHPF